MAKLGLWAYILPKKMESVLSDMLKIAEIPSDTPQQIEQKELTLERAERVLADFKGLADIYLSADFGLDIGADQYLRILNRIVSNTGERARLPEYYLEGREIADRKRFLHWQFEFPEVYFDKKGLKSEPGFDCVIGNPPYINAIRLNKILSEYEKPYWTGKFESAKGAYDIYLLFYELALTQTRKGGATSFITPNKYLSAPYAQAFRTMILEKHTLVELCDLSAVKVFKDPSVYPVVSIFRAKTKDRRGGPKVRVFSPPSKEKLGDAGIMHLHDHPIEGRIPENIWGYLLLYDDRLFWNAIGKCDVLADHGIVQASSTASEAEEFTAAIAEEAPGLTNKKFIKTGAIDPFFSKWEFQQVRHQGNNYTRPVLNIEHSVITKLRREQYQKPKLIFAKVASYLEVFPDLKGDFASVDTNFFYDSSDDLRLYAALLSSEPVRFLYTALFGALRMRGGDFQFQAPQLRLIPIPKKPQEQPSGETREADKLTQLLDNVQYDDFKKEVAKLLDETKDASTEYAMSKGLLCELTDRLLDVSEGISKIDAAFNPFRAIPRSTSCKKLISVFSDELKFCRELNEDQVLQTHHDIDGIRLRRYGGKWRLSILAKLRMRENGEWRSTWVRDGRNIRREWKEIYEMEMDENKGLYYTLVFNNLSDYEKVSIPSGKTRSVQEKVNAARIPDFSFNEQVREMIELEKTRSALIRRSDRLKECVDLISYYMYGMESEIPQARSILIDLEKTYS